MSKLPAIGRMSSIASQYDNLPRAQSSFPGFSQKRSVAVVSFERAHSVDPCMENDRRNNPETRKQTAVLKARSNKHLLSRNEVDEIAAATKKAMEAALVPCSKRVILSIDKELEDEAAKWRAEWQNSSGSANTIESGSKGKRPSAMTRSSRSEEDVDRIAPPAQFYDGRAMRAASCCADMAIQSFKSDAANPRNTAVERSSNSMTSASEAAFLFDLKQPDPLDRFPPVTARARGTYLYGLKGDVVKSHSLVASLPMRSLVDFRNLDDDKQFPRQVDRSRQCLKTSGGRSWNSMSEEQREERLRNDFGAMLVQFKGYVHELALMSGDWYFRSNQRDRLCTEIAQTHAKFSKIIREQRPLLSHEQAGHPLTEEQIHELMKEGFNTQLTNALLLDAKRGDDELAEFELQAFKFSRRADWMATNQLRQGLQDARERLRILKLKLRGGDLKSSWKLVKSKIPEVNASSKIRALPSSSLIARTLRDSLKDSTFDRDGVGFPTEESAICHQTESNKMQVHLDQVLTAQMDMKVQQKIEDIRLAMNSKHLQDASPSAGAFSKLNVCSMPGYRVERRGSVQRLFNTDDDSTEK